MVEAETAGSPTSDERWTRKSLRQLSESLLTAGYVASPPTVGRLLRQLGLSLKSNRKEKEATSNHPERDAQFRYLAQQRAEFIGAGVPVISVDTKKKELVGEFKNHGQAWSKEARIVNVHDFKSDAVGRAVPYGIYDVAQNQGTVYVGSSSDTAEFAVSVIARWWEEEGKVEYPAAKSLLIMADGGGSNGCRVRSWKEELQKQLSDRAGLAVTVCHYPTGCSKYNPIEHRLFSYISINWAGKPLKTFETILSYIRGTTTRTGLKVKAFLQEGRYEKGKKVSDDEMKKLNLEKHAICPNWNYTISPRVGVNLAT